MLYESAISGEIGASRTRPVLLPVKGFDRAKSRLSSALQATVRADLARRLFEHVLDAVTPWASEGGILVATDGDDVAALCAERGIETLRDPAHASLRLPDVLDRALAHLARRGACEALVLMADLPRVRAEHLPPLLEPFPGADVTLVPDLSGQGTNALRLPLGTGFSSHFGHPRSGRMHLEEAAHHGLSAQVIQCEGIALDLDRPVELEAARASGFAVA